jgi:MoaA/NifB/PqqE/SkfB family radical SAM enzyme
MSHPLTTSVERFIWELTSACPLRCSHCYSESGRHPATTLGREDMLRIVELILRTRPRSVSLSGGEPLLAPWWSEAARRIRDAGIPVTLFTSGWGMDERTAQELARSVTSVCVRFDGGTVETHERIRQRPGSFNKALVALDLLEQVKRERVARGEGCYTFGIDYTVMRSNLGQTERFIEDITLCFPSLDFIRFGAVLPVGMAEEGGLAGREILTENEMLALVAAELRLGALAKNGAKVSVTDVRCFRPCSPLSSAGQTVAHIEASGQLRAFSMYEPTVGSVLEEPFEVLWHRVLAWRNDPFVTEQLRSIRTLRDLTRVARALSHRFGSEADTARSTLRGRTAAA